MTTERAELLAVTQAVRDAAASAIIDACDRTLDIRMGERDDNPIVQAFARAALSPPAIAPEGFVVVPREPTEAMLEAARIAGDNYYFGDKITWEEIPVMYRAMLAAAENAVTPPVSYADYQQRRGMLPDIIESAIAEYDEWMKDDHYDARVPLDKIIERLKSARDIYDSPALAAAETAPPVSDGPDHARSIMFGYTNYRGEKAVRTAIPQRIYWGATDWHPEPQWLLVAWDSEKEAVREFALSDCVFDRATICGETPVSDGALREALDQLCAAIDTAREQVPDEEEGLAARVFACYLNGAQRKARAALSPVSVQHEVDEKRHD